VAPRYVVHRGGAALWPENSLEAFRSAIGLGARLLEFDVHLTADGNVAVIHDATLDRTTTGSGAVAARTAAELRRLRLKRGDGTLADEGVPMLDDVLALAAPTGGALLVELKTPGPAVSYDRIGGAVRATPGARYPGLEQKVIASLAEAGVAERAIVMAFNPAVLAEVRALAPRQATTLLVDRHHVVDAGAQGAEAVEWAVEAGAAFLGLHYTLCDERVVAAARTAGISIGVFTVNAEAEMRRVAALGVDVIITDRADLVAKLEREAAPRT
jgi:glycerophosphoryl diester phosphodiesterase